MTVSIIIRSKNESQYIGQVLEAIYAQTYKDFEVLLIDSGSTDNTIKIAKTFPVKVYEILPEEFTYGFATNYGFSRSAGEIVVCLSAHAIPASEKWLENMMSNFRDSMCAAVMGKDLPMPECNPFDRRGMSKLYDVPRAEINDCHFDFGATNAAIRKSVWEEMPFDENLSYAEDNDWGGKVKAKGYRIFFDPAATVYHSHNDTYKQLINRFYNEAYALRVLGRQSYNFPRIALDFLAGSAYDMTYVLMKRYNLKWFFYAPIRRFCMNIGRLKANKRN
ncbi:MAG: glycosyltransferase [Nitrospira sp.]|nr:glycosyltransferase [Candidatus Brocadiales bacterium]MBL7050285.1 glycosyltransferase [Nitrospira sp.]